MQNGSQFVWLKHRKQVQSSFTFTRLTLFKHETKLSQVAYLKSKQELGNSVDKISFPITFCDLKVLATESEQINLCYCTFNLGAKTIRENRK